MISPQVHAVLLLLNGQLLPSEISSMGLTYHQNHMVLLIQIFSMCECNITLILCLPLYLALQSTNETLGSKNHQRLASLQRFKEKKKNLCFKKKIMYTVRKEVASRYKSLCFSARNCLSPGQYFNMNGLTKMDQVKVEGFCMMNMWYIITVCYFFLWKLPCHNILNYVLCKVEAFWEASWCRKTHSLKFVWSVLSVMSSTRKWQKMKKTMNKTLEGRKMLDQWILPM